MNRLKSTFETIKPVLRNKYAISGFVFFIWVGFVDDNNIIEQVKSRMKLSAVNNEREFYLTETMQSVEDLKLLQNDRELLEKFAREKYLMKKDNEEIFVFTVEETE